MQMWQQLIIVSYIIQTHRIGHTDWETGGSLMACLPNFQMKHGDSRIKFLICKEPKLTAHNWQK